MHDPQENAALIQMLFQQTPGHAVLLIDLDGTIREWNHAAERLFGRTRDEALGQPFESIFTESDRTTGVPELELATAASDALSEDDRWQQRADGSRFWSTGLTTVLRDANGAAIGYGKILRDRTDLKEQIASLVTRIEALQAADRDKEVVLTTFSHELRNLLTSMIHGVQLLSSADADASRRSSLLELMQEQMSVVRRMTEDLLDAQRVRRGKAPLELGVVDLQPLLGRVIDARRVQLAAKQLQLDFMHPPQPLRVNGDSARLYQVFANLVENAVKYTPPGGKIWVKATTEQPEAVVHIEDTGVGVPPQMLSRIFELFTQINPSQSQRGLGVGLALVRELVELHGGSVQARSDGPNKGSKFSVRLPLHG